MSTTHHLSKLLRPVQSVMISRTVNNPSITYCIQRFYGRLLQHEHFDKPIVNPNHHLVKPSNCVATSLRSRSFLSFTQRRLKSTGKVEEGLPEILEEDLEESFTHGWGPGGQSVNKTTNCCVLRHIPTGICVKCHETRSLAKNRELGRLRLRQKLDLHFNGEESKQAQERKVNSIRKMLKKKKTNERLEKLKAFKEREGLT